MRNFNKGIRISKFSRVSISRGKITMTDETRRYIAKLKLSGIKLDTVEDNNGTPYLMDIILENTEAPVTINFEHINNGLVIIGEYFMNKLRYNKEIASSGLNVDMTWLSLDIQDYWILMQIMSMLPDGDTIKYFADYDKTLDNFDDAIYRLVHRVYFRAISLEKYAEALKLYSDYLMFSTRLMISNLADKFESNGKRKVNRYSLITCSEYEELYEAILSFDNGISWNSNLRRYWNVSDYRKILNYILYDLSELLKDHNKVSSYSESEKVSNVDELKMVFTDEFKRNSKKIVPQIHLVNPLRNKELMQRLSN
jgi:hypothetical protein